MKLVIFGSRSLFPTAGTIDRAVFARWGVLPSLVICGMARGADLSGRTWAKFRGIPVLEMPADWDRYGRRAGILRNEQMAGVATAGLGFWDGSSAGTANMVKNLQRRGIYPHVVR